MIFSENSIYNLQKKIKTCHFVLARNLQRVLWFEIDLFLSTFKEIYHNMEQNTVSDEELKSKAEAADNTSAESSVNANTETSEPAEEKRELTPEEKIAALEADLEEQKKRFVYQAAEFDNYRKRTIKEKSDLLKYGAEGALKALLPVIDDLERAMQHIDKAEDVASVKEGMNLIYQKFQNYLKQQQMEVIPAEQGCDFDDSIHEAVTMFPAPDPSLKGKVVDCVTKGYKLSDKVVRFAKVVVGQ